MQGKKNYLHVNVRYIKGNILDGKDIKILRVSNVVSPRHYRVKDLEVPLIEILSHFFSQW